MSLNINKAQQSGFTIVELLIVVVVIAILAAITIVSYTGITQQANTAAAQSNATTVLKKAELYANDEGNTGYPTTLAALTSAASSKVYALPAGSATLVASEAALEAAPTTKSIVFETCGSGAGIILTYWNYSTPDVATVTAGDVSGTCTVAAT
ncbi:prepilin-type N-terminal cleavage/methylation domain-containing protein [Candidatus Saccharibacteria bacterium]|nr:prepilin-type N-terminal cleavage/methylation domain-containing protein [Candidatus Saccharibacteria bacterium]